MKFLLHCVSMVVLANITLAQRPFYAGTKPIGYPELHSRFQTNETESTTVLANRLGESGGAGASNVTTTTERLPYDALGQKELIDRIKTWPREQWPFWYLNYVAIEEHRRNRPTQSGNNLQVAGQANVQTMPNPNQQGAQQPAQGNPQGAQPNPTTNNQNWQNAPNNGQNFQPQPQPSNQNWQVQPSNNQGWATRSGNSDRRQNQNWQREQRTWSN